VLFPIAAFMTVVATRSVIPAPAAWLIVLGNALWVVASVGLLAGGLIVPNALGLGFVLAQAAAVAILTWLEYSCLRRLPAASLA
jgi:hypothetical protein